MSCIHAAAVAFQAGGRAVVRRCLRRSGVTPWDVRHSVISARDVKCADRARPVTPDAFGWSAPPLSRNHVQNWRLIAQGLAQSFLAGSWNEPELVARGESALGRRWKWLRPLVQRVLGAFPDKTLLRTARLVGFLCDDDGFQQACQKHNVRLRLISAEPSPTRFTMSPMAGKPGTWPVPSITSPSELAEYLALDLPHLEWLADCQGRERVVRQEPLRNYRYRWIAKSSGSFRLIESPKPRLKLLQRRLLDELLSQIPAHAGGPRLSPWPVGRDLRGTSCRSSASARDGPATSFRRSPPRGSWRLP